MHLRTILAPILLALPLLGAAASSEPTEPQDDWMVHMQRADGAWSYVPSTITLVPGGLVQLMVFGDGQFSLTLDDHPEFDADIVSQTGTVRTAEFRAPMQSGSYAFHDKHHPEARGTLVVAPRAAAASVTAEAPVVGVVPGGYESRFAPERIEVAPGAAVTFRANGSFQHNLRATDGAFSAGDVPARGEATFTAPSTPGEHPFECRFHADAGMRGVLVVLDDAAGAAPDEAQQRTPAPGFLALALVAALVALLVGRSR